MMRADLYCPKCGRRMHEDESQRRRYRGLLERLWRCDNCLHEELTKERVRERTGPMA